MEWPPSGAGWRKTNRMGEKCSCCFDAFSVSAFVSKQKNCSGLIAGAGFSTGCKARRQAGLFLWENFQKPGRFLAPPGLISAGAGSTIEVVSTATVPPFWNRREELKIHGRQ